MAISLPASDVETGWWRQKSKLPAVQGDQTTGLQSRRHPTEIACYCDVQYRPSAVLSIVKTHDIIEDTCLILVGRLAYKSLQVHAL